MRSDESLSTNRHGANPLGNFGEMNPRASFSGGETDHLFISDRGQQFYDLGAVSGLAHPGDGRTLCQLDFDRDGWTDFVVASANSPSLQLYRNRIGQSFHAEANGSRMIALRFVGGNRAAAPSADFGPRDGFGARAEVFVDGGVLLREHRCGDGRAGLNSNTLVIGIGDNERVERLRVTWPGGQSYELNDIAAGSLITAYEDEAEVGGAFVREDYLRGTFSESAPRTRQETFFSFAFQAEGEGPPVQLVSAMTTTCKSCKKLQPRVGRLRESFSESEVSLMALSTDLDETPDQLRAYVEAQHPNYQVLTDASAADREALREHVLERFGEDLTPVTLILGRDGRVHDTVPGIPTVSQVRRILARIRSKD